MLLSWFHFSYLIPGYLLYAVVSGFNRLSAIRYAQRLKWIGKSAMAKLVGLNHIIQGPESGPWLTFIPGIGNDATFWAFHARVLSRHYRTLVFDPWGHGDSTPPPEDCRFRTIVEGVVDLWDELGIAESHVVGLGFGGSVALALGLDYPDRLDSIVACCCRPRQPDNRRDFWRKRRESALQFGIEPIADQTVGRWLSEDFRATHPHVDQQLRNMVKRTSVEGYRAYVGAFVEMDFEDRLSNLKVPTLLVAAENDHGGGPVEDMQEMADRIPGSQLEIIAGCGHICNFEAPGEVTRILSDFLQAPINRHSFKG